MYDYVEVLVYTDSRWAIDSFCIFDAERQIDPIMLFLIEPARAPPPFSQPVMPLSWPHEKDPATLLTSLLLHPTCTIQPIGPSVRRRAQIPVRGSISSSTALDPISLPNRTSWTSSYSPPIIVLSRLTVPPSGLAGQGHWGSLFSRLSLFRNPEDAGTRSLVGAHMALARGKS